MIKNIVIFYVSLFFMCCSSPTNVEEISEDLVSSHFIFDNSKKIFISDLGDNWTTETIVIDKELTYQVGSFFSSYHLIDSNLLISDRTASQISIINNYGELIQSLNHPSPGIDRYSSIGAIDTRKEGKEIVVFDDERQKFDVFSKHGEYLTSHDNPILFWDYEELGSGAKIYNVEDINVSEYLGGKNDYFLFFIDGKESRFFNKIEDLNSLSTIPIQDFGQFSYFRNHLQFRSPLSDIVYVFDEHGNYTKTATFEFAYLNEFRDVANNQDIINKADHFYDKKIPRPAKVIVDAESEDYFCVFWEGGKRFFIQVKEGVQVNIPSTFYRIGGVVCKAPRFYEDDVFFHKMYKYEYDYLQSLLNKEDVVRDDVISKLRSLRDKYADESDIVIIMNRYEQ